MTTNNLLDRHEAAKYLGVTYGTMEVWACRKQYDLPYIKIGRKAQYRIEDLDRLLERKTIRFPNPRS